MKFIKKDSDSLSILKSDQQLSSERRKLIKFCKNLIFALFRIVVLVGISYVILSPIIEILSKSLFSDSDVTDPMVYVIPKEPTLEKYSRVIQTMGYWTIIFKTLLSDVLLMLIQVFICSMVGYGFARFNFPLKKVLFACVVVMIVIPSHAIMLPLYLTFKNFFGMNLLHSITPLYLMTIFGCGLFSGIYIYLFNQFFRGLPKEIEEAAFVDGAGAFYTYFRIMLVNAMPSVITVSVFSLVWQYNDKFFINLYIIQDWMSVKLETIRNTIAKVYNIQAATLTLPYLYAAIMLDLIPVLLIYVILQRNFVEGVERSGIVG